MNMQISVVVGKAFLFISISRSQAKSVHTYTRAHTHTHTHTHTKLTQQHTRTHIYYYAHNSPKNHGHTEENCADCKGSGEACKKCGANGVEKADSFVAGKKKNERVPFKKVGKYKVGANQGHKDYNSRKQDHKEFLKSSNRKK